jgi:hypothetical protein
MDLLCHMHQSDDRGYLDVGIYLKPDWDPEGEDAPDGPRLMSIAHPVSKMLGRLLGEDYEVCEDALRELVGSGVASIDPGGRLYSRRMVRESAPAGSSAKGGLVRAGSAERGSNGRFLTSDPAVRSSDSSSVTSSPSPTPSPPELGGSALNQAMSAPRPKRAAPTAFSGDFVRFWEQTVTDCGERGSKSRAWAAWQALGAERPETEKLIDAYRAQVDAKRRRRAGGEFASGFQHLERWLRNRRWTDDPRERYAGKGNGETAAPFVNRMLTAEEKAANKGKTW